MNGDDDGKGTEGERTRQDLAPEVGVGGGPPVHNAEAGAATASGDVAGAAAAVEQGQAAAGDGAAERAANLDATIKEQVAKGRAEARGKVQGRQWG